MFFDDVQMSEQLSIFVLQYFALAMCCGCWHAWNLRRRERTSLQRFPCQFSKLFDNIVKQTDPTIIRQLEHSEWALLLFLRYTFCSIKKKNPTSPTLWMALVATLERGGERCHATGRPRPGLPAVGKCNLEIELTNDIVITLAHLFSKFIITRTEGPPLFS